VVAGSSGDQGPSFTLVRFEGDSITDVDSDLDGVPNDGDGSGVAGDNPCRVADYPYGPPSSTPRMCDDNCPGVPNPDQVVCGNSTVGIACTPPLVTEEQLVPTSGFVSIDIPTRTLEANNWTPAARGLPVAPVPYLPLPTQYQLVLLRAGTSEVALDVEPRARFSQCGEYLAPSGPPYPGPALGLAQPYRWFSQWKVATGNAVEFSLPAGLPRGARYWWTIRGRDGSVSPPAPMDHFKSVFIMPRKSPEDIVQVSPDPAPPDLVSAQSFRTWSEANGAFCSRDYDDTEIEDGIRFVRYKQTCRFDKQLADGRSRGLVGARLQLALQVLLQARGGGHGPDEFADLESIVPRLYLLSRLVMEAGRAKLQ
jgi:hypothetical protein